MLHKYWELIYLCNLFFPFLLSAQHQNMFPYSPLIYTLGLPLSLPVTFLLPEMTCSVLHEGSLSCCFTNLIVHSVCLRERELETVDHHSLGWGLTFCMSKKLPGNSIILVLRLFWITRDYISAYSSYSLCHSLGNSVGQWVILNLILHFLCVFLLHLDCFARG